MPAPPHIVFTSPEPLEILPGPASPQATPPQNGALRKPSALGCESWVCFNDRRHNLVNREELGSSPTVLSTSHSLCCVALVADGSWFLFLHLPLGTSLRSTTIPPLRDGHKVAPDVKDGTSFLHYMPPPVGNLSVVSISTAAFDNERTGGLVETPHTSFLCNLGRNLNVDFSQRRNASSSLSCYPPFPC